MTSKSTDAQSSIQQPPDHRGTAENGPFNPPDEFVHPMRAKRGGKKIAFIVNGKRTDDPTP